MYEGAAAPDKIFALVRHPHPHAVLPSASVAPFDAPLPLQEWLDARTLLAGTKDNRLLRVSLDAHPGSRRVVDIPLPGRPVHSSRPRCWPFSALARAFTPPPDPHAAAPAHSVLHHAPSSSHVGAPAPSFAPHPLPQPDSCGVHALCRSPGDGAYIATGGADPRDVALLRADTLEAHTLCTVRWGADVNDDCNCARVSRFASTHAHFCSSRATLIASLRWRGCHQLWLRPAAAMRP